MRYIGKIDKLNHIVVSDPSYDEDVEVRFEMNNLNEKDWLTEINIKEVEEKLDKLTVKGIEFDMILKKDNECCFFDEKNNLKYLNKYQLKKYEIGMDTACVALGINDKAKEIINSRDEWQPECSLRTGTDGFFGDVIVGTEKTDKEGTNNPSFIIINGYISDYMDNSIDDIKNYLLTQFEIPILTREQDKEIGI